MKNTFQKLILFFLLFSSISWIACDEEDNPVGGNNNFAAEAPFSYAVKVVDHMRIRLVAITGTVNISGNSQTDSISISGIRRVKSNSMADAEQHLPDLSVDFQDVGSEVTVITNQPQDSEGRGYEVDYTITLPDTLQVQVNAVTGVITISSITGNVSIGHVTGDITLSDVLGNSTVSLVTGIITGEIYLPLNGIIDLGTVTGNINLQIPVNTSAVFSANVTTGSISTSNLMLQNQVSTSTFLSGTLDNGEGNISLRTVTGNISVIGF